MPVGLPVAAIVHSLKIIFTLALFIIPVPAIAEKGNSNTSKELEPLQTHISQRDLKIIEQLVAIAQHNSAQVQETKAAMGLRAFADIVTIEISPSQTTTNYTSPDASPENERSLSFTITVDPIKFLGSFRQLPVMQARWNEARVQKRVAVVQYYLAYLQARQATLIASYQMQKFTISSPIASLHSQANSSSNVNNLTNPEYVAAATQMLKTSAQERIALEELASCVGLSPQAIIALLTYSPR
ncbi:MAG: hypothetical protein HC862_24965 [Scytonema sp. RU_4_4]|nr:hypothetical protein [Scytonema sp. RU_4_4]NJR76440.1 hypothetical protein [Scytonema sp. CRU_2_7]